MEVNHRTTRRLHDSTTTRTMNYDAHTIDNLFNPRPTDDEKNQEPPEDYAREDTGSHLQDGATRTATIDMEDTDRRITVEVTQHYRGCERRDYRTTVQVWIDTIEQDVPDHETLEYYGTTSQTHASRCATQVAESVLSEPEGLYFDVTLFHDDDDVALSDWSSLLDDETDSERDRRQRQHDGLTMQL